MDPDETLRRLRQLAQGTLDDADDLATLAVPSNEQIKMAELIQALDSWITGGGFLPDEWRR